MPHLYILGSCSGTEPYPERHQTAILLEVNGHLYLFDAGENCAWTAQNMGLNVGDISTIFISHPHFDHIGGLAQLFWIIRKLNSRKVNDMTGRNIDIFLPGPTGQRSYQAVLDLLAGTEGNFNINFTISPHDIQPGVIFKNNDITVETLSNQHIPNDVSYSFRITVGDKVIVFSGDVKSIHEMDRWLEQPTDMLLMETGHHKVADICAYVNDHPTINYLTFVHHGREILDTFEKSLDTALTCLGSERVCISFDGQVFEL